MWLGKRFFDFILSFIGLLFLSPLFLLLSFWIIIDSRGPVFFRQERVGLNGRIFRIHKFRSMIRDSSVKGLQITVGNDQRITKAGKLLRKYKLDELPQLIDVLYGKMSFVGPRPEVPKYVAFYSEEDRNISLAVRPGITDLASVHFKNESEILALSENPEKEYIEKILPMKLKYHRQYVESASLSGDLKLIIHTLKTIFIAR
ncbi:sugar transferase [Bdellovibrio sp. HCB-110]|uniref:sugar transferase n=1 Tax=Bdellovibrio sp. HCB-110 TaxID=3391182 RepID=UPI0039B4AE5F